MTDTTKLQGNVGKPFFAVTESRDPGVCMLYPQFYRRYKTSNADSFVVKQAAGNADDRVRYRLEVLILDRLKWDRLRANLRDIFVRDGGLFRLRGCLFTPRPIGFQSGQSHRTGFYDGVLRL